MQPVCDSADVVGDCIASTTPYDDENEGDNADGGYMYQGDAGSLADGE